MRGLLGDPEATQEGRSRQAHSRVELGGGNAVLAALQAQDHLLSSHFQGASGGLP